VVVSRFSPAKLSQGGRTFEKIRLVHEQDHARLSEPATVRNALEQTRRFIHSVDI
jgi:hypothetical protein